MWEVMQACVIMHNMIIQDDRKNRVRRHVAEVDHELPADFADFLAMHAVTAMFTSNLKMISLSTCGGSKYYQQMPRHLDLASFITFVLVILLSVVF
jgi:hypothetical protein